LSVSFNVAGTHTIGAQVNDNAGVVSTASVTVTIGATTAPTVSMTSPANGASFVAPTSITFTATASDSDGTIQRVEFYVGATLVGTDTTSPYSATWPAVIGAYSVSAVATDNSGSSTVSAWRDFIVTATSLLSTAIFIPASPSDAVDYYRFEIFEAGANPNTAAPIAVQNIGVPPVVSGESSADVRSTIVALAPGNYIATAGFSVSRTPMLHGMSELCEGSAVGAHTAPIDVADSTASQPAVCENTVVLPNAQPTGWRARIMRALGSML